MRRVSVQEMCVMGLKSASTVCAVIYRLLICSLYQHLIATCVSRQVLQADRHFLGVPATARASRARQDQRLGGVGIEWGQHNLARSAFFVAISLLWHKQTDLGSVCTVDVTHWHDLVLPWCGETLMRGGFCN